MNRWKLAIQEFDHEIIHIDGKKNKEADLLSRSGVFKISNQKPNTIYQLLLNPPTMISNSHNEETKSAKFQKSEVINFLKNVHAQLIHPGYNKMYQTLKRYIKIEDLRKLCHKVTCRGGMRLKRR
ncbi:hypothetical protein DMUE_5916 [Dictyocoela muelleri]|nr:hypothetical protein DMUE_5916 [Dictyocoela muelleri]